MRMANPYDPQAPAKPDYFGGRNSVLSSARERLRKAIVQDQSGGLLVYGHRGVGKTSLLHKIIDIANEEFPGGISFCRRLSRTISNEELYVMLLEELQAQIHERQNLIEKLRKKGEDISKVKALSIEIDLTRPQLNNSQYQLWKKAVKHIHNAEFILVALDDADYLSSEAIGELKTIVENVSQTPVLLVTSGGIQFEKRLVDEYSPIARIFSGASYNLGRFTLDETKEVLNKPLVSQKTSWEDSAIEQIQKLTFGYPYLVQCLASASYLDNASITKGQVIQSVEKAVDIGKSWLDHEIPTASDKDVMYFLQLIKLDKDMFRSSEISSLGVPSTYIGRLVKLGILKQISRGRYRLEKSPMVAIYEGLKRRLTNDSTKHP
ncbi:hypothetical protein AUJ68_01050 [Candidatus Woesearchaeota archaeon CG1_02_57_44]|nr:MAG: hypothetical protein AUJ68_01050 [Candidatus Woesearchaeota archaeon CG1_02_57_44]